jgi:hypothetical protein
MLITKANELETTLSRRAQKKKDHYNYFFNPVIEIALRNARVFYVDPNCKFIVFIFSKLTDINLYLFCKSISNTLLYKTKKLAKEILYTTKIHDKESFPFYLKRDNDTEFTIKCNVNNAIKFYYNNDLERFKVPTTGMLYNTVYINIKNIWEDITRVGFNLEIKSIHQEMI